MNKDEKLTLKEFYEVQIKANEKVDRLYTLVEKYHGDVRVNMEKTDKNEEEITRIRNKSNIIDGIIGAVTLGIAYLKIKE